PTGTAGRGARAAGSRPGRVAARARRASGRGPPSPCRRSSSPPGPTWTATRRSAGARARRAGRATGPTGSSRGRVTTSIRWARKGRSFPTRASAWPTSGSCRGSAATGRSDRRVMPAAAAERALARLTIGHYMLRRWSLEEDVRHLERLGFRSIRLAIEVIHPLRQDLSFINMLVDAREIARAAGRRGGYVLDFFHSGWERRLLDTIRRDARRRIHAVQMCDYKRVTMRTMDRALLGKGILPLPAIFRALEQGGY